jgi:hypothetical protein
MYNKKHKRFVMSQEKVDRYKKEKKNRAKTLKKKKAKKAVSIIVLAALVGAAIGVPLGRKLYNVEAAKRAANATITAGLYANWFDEFWVTNGYSERVGFATDEDDYSDLLGTATDSDYATATDSDYSEDDYDYDISDEE